MKRSRPALVCGLFAHLMTPTGAIGTCQYPLGDLTATGSTNVADAMCAILVAQWTMLGQAGNTPGCLVSPWQRADLNCDRTVTIADAQLLVGWILQGALPAAIDSSGSGCADACELDSDGDGIADWQDCAPGVNSANSAADEVCNGWDDDCDGEVDTPAIVATECSDGDMCTGVGSCPALAVQDRVQITELGPLQPTGAAPLPQWVEVFNGTQSPVNLHGWALQHGAGAHTIQNGGVLWLQPGDFLVLGQTRNLAENGGTPVQYAYGATFALSASGSVMLVAPGGAVASIVHYGAPPFGIPILGRSFALRAAHAEATDPANWAPGQASYGSVGLFGTPGGPNLDVTTINCQSTSPLNCDDANPCTDDSCHAMLGCLNVPNSLPCNDGSACTVGDQCSGGNCVGGPATDCDDNNICTTDACNPLSGCIHAFNNLPCNDGIACTQNDACQAGQCIGAPPAGGTNLAQGKTIFFNNGSASGAALSTLVDGVFRPKGTQYQSETVWWNGTATVIEVNLGAGYFINGARLQADNNDTYRIDVRNPSTLAWSTWWNVPTAFIPPGGMSTRPNPDNHAEWQSLPTVPADAIRVFATGGDNAYSLSEIQLRAADVITVASQGRPVTLVAGSASGASAGTLTDGTFLAEGTNWQTGTVWWNDIATTHEIGLAGNTIVSALKMQLDDNDSYEILYRDLSDGQFKLLWTAPAVGGTGMRIRPIPGNQAAWLRIPPVLTNAIRLRTASGDGMYSASELQAGPALCP